MELLKKIKFFNELKAELEPQFVFPITMVFEQGLHGPDTFSVTFQEEVTVSKDGNTWKENHKMQFKHKTSTIDQGYVNTMFGHVNEREKFVNRVKNIGVVKDGRIYTLVVEKGGETNGK